MKKSILTVLFLSLCLPAEAYDTYNIPDSVPNPVIELNVFRPGERVTIDGDSETSTFTIPQKYIDPLILAAEDWCGRIDESPITPVIYSYTSTNEYNAMAASPYVTVAESPYQVTITNAKLHNWTITSQNPDDTTDALVEIGKGINPKFPGWQEYTGKHPLYHDELSDIYPVLMHEMMHSLGLSSGAAKYKEASGDNNYYFTKDTLTPLTIYDSQIRIYTGTSNPITDSGNELAPSQGGLIGEGGYDIETYSPYFIGENAIKVIGGDSDYDSARQKIADNHGIINYSDYYPSKEKEYPTVYGLPIHPSDGDGYDISHIELRNSYMSHQDFRNWLVPMEAELALMNDLGYNIELKKYFGKSYYLNNQTDTYTNGFSEWNGTSYTGAPSEISQAVGIHIYGDYNEITQSGADISMLGEGSIGVRVDGTNNTYNLNSGNICANGKENLGIAVTWGNRHNVNVASGTKVTATGEKGIAASFDYGSNLFGTAGSNIKGSFINYDFEESSGKNEIPDIENSSELVSNFNVNGTLEGKKAAIYISDNAYVKNININNGAQIKGNIISEWNSVLSTDKALVQVYDPTSEEWKIIDKDNPDEFYYTNLNFDAASGVDVTGNITGENEIYNTLKINNENSSVINFGGEELKVNSLVNKGEINISKIVDLQITNGEITGGGTINVLNGGGLNMRSSISNIENSISLDSAAFNCLNNSAEDISPSGLEVSGRNTLALDLNVSTLAADKFVFNDSNDLTVNGGAGFNINNVNMINANKALTKSKYYVPFISSDYNNQNLLGNVTFSDSKSIMTPIFKYNLEYEEDLTQGQFVLSRGGANNYSSYNPSVYAASVGAQVGGYLAQLNSYDIAFANYDMLMSMPRSERIAMQYENQYAQAGNGANVMTFNPNQRAEEGFGLWFRPYATFETVGLKNGPDVKNTAYGTYVGGDSKLIKLKRGWGLVISSYAGYNGSHSVFDGNSIYQNGGQMGATGIVYKNNFFTAITTNIGANSANAETMYGREDFVSITRGLASKTGYNFGFKDDKFIIQPSLLLSNSSVYTLDYTNAAGVRIKSDPLMAFQIAPGVKFIGNLKHSWQPYLGVQMVWNLMDKTKFTANSVDLEELSTKPYIQYGVGVQKHIGERFTGYMQSMVRNGGRNGIALSIGLRWKIGK